jgi:predicted CopG family antitoxin
MVTISVTGEAFEAIKASLSEGSEADTRPDGKSGLHITLARDVLDRLKLIREPGESYSDVIVRIAAE